MVITEKRDVSIEVRVHNGTCKKWALSKEHAASPTATLESIMIIAVIHAIQERDVITADVTNAFIPAMIPEVQPRDERVMMKITRVLVDMLVQLDLGLYAPHVVMEIGKKVISCEQYMVCYKQLCCDIKSAERSLRVVGLSSVPMIHA